MAQIIFLGNDFRRDRVVAESPNGVTFYRMI